MHLSKHGERYVDFVVDGFDAAICTAVQMMIGIETTTLGRKWALVSGSDRPSVDLSTNSAPDPMQE